MHSWLDSGLLFPGLSRNVALAFRCLLGKKRSTLHYNNDRHKPDGYHNSRTFSNELSSFVLNIGWLQCSCTRFVVNVLTHAK